MKAVVWMERTACLDVRARIGESHVVSSVRDYVVEMLSKGSATDQAGTQISSCNDGSI